MKVEEVIEILNQFKEQSQKHKDSYTPIGSNLLSVLKIMQDTYQENIDAFNMAIEALDRTRWIPVSEYNGYGIFVPVIVDGKREDFAYYDNADKCWYGKLYLSDEDARPMMLNVTHVYVLPKFSLEQEF